ncbi:hypothetical protein ACIBH1_37310 [Nonomuraea sp. NPDC050663]|uniref:hypothetical protein n=1 Tax=Nonomuraea sp. NPDC050663 TaxID=3364370 RepID=UPI0037B551E0
MRKRRIGILAGGLIATTVFVGGLAPAQASVAESSEVSASAACVTVSRWYTERSRHYVKVRNHCSTSKSFCVDIPLWPDSGPYTVSGGSIKTFMYSYAGSPTGDRIYSC